MSATVKFLFIKVTTVGYFINCVYFLKNFFRDPWNTFDFITVIGSVIDVMVMELGVSHFRFLHFSTY